MRISPPIPVLRMFDVERTLDFYCGYLGFGKDWEHRFEPGFPLYVQVSRSEATIHLSEHYGDGSPNDGPGGRCMTVIDPSGNHLRFAQPD